MSDQEQLPVPWNESNLAEVAPLDGRAMPPAADVMSRLERTVVAPRARPTRRWMRPVALALVALLLIAAAVTWWAERRALPVKYLTVAVTRGSIARTITATGTVNPELTIIIGSYVSGVVESVSCDYNTRVKRGQLCAKIDPRPYQAALEQAKGQLARDTGQLEGARANLARYGHLVPEDSIAVQTYEDQRALVHQLEGSVQFDRATVRNAEVNLGYTNIVSPVDGTVVARNITIGQTVAASFQTPTLFLIASDLTKMQVDTNVSESDIGAVKLGDQAQFSVEAFNRPFSGTVVQVRQAPQTVQNVVTYDAVLAVANPDFQLKPGMTATVGIVTDRRDNVLRVPDQALRFTPSSVRAKGGDGLSPPPSSGTSGSDSAGGRRARVWILANGRPAALEVSTGLDDDTNTEVVAGDLATGMQVIVGEQPAGASAPAGPLRFGL